jgi:hypothetical protein
VFCCEIPRASATGVSLEVNRLRVAETKHTDPTNDPTTNGITLLCMVLLEPGYRVYVYSQNEYNSLKPEPQVLGDNNLKYFLRLGLICLHQLKS